GTRLRVEFRGRWATRRSEGDPDSVAAERPLQHSLNFDFGIDGAPRTRDDAAASDNDQIALLSQFSDFREHDPTPSASLGGEALLHGSGDRKCPGECTGDIEGEQAASNNCATFTCADSSRIKIEVNLQDVRALNATGPRVIVQQDAANLRHPASDMGENGR